MKSNDNMKLIDKSALVAEIENIRKHYIERDDFDNGWNFALDKIISFLDTLEVKELQEEPVSEELEKIVEEIAEPTILNAYGTKELARRLRNTICGTSVSEDLNEAVTRIIKETSKIPNLSEYEALYHCAVEGAQWQKEHLWKPADGDDLPEIDREVIALLDNGKVVFAHRPPEYWDGKNIVTGKVTRHYPKTYDKDGWNIPNVKYWLDCLMQKEIEL